MSVTYTDPVMTDGTGQDIVTKLNTIAGLMGDGVINDSAAAADKTYSSNKITSDFAPKNIVPTGASTSNKLATASDVNAKVSWDDAEKSVKKNLWNTDITEGTANTGITVTHNSDKSITLSGTSTASFNFNKDENSANKIFNLEAGKSYIFSTQTTNPNVIKQVYVKDTSSSEWRQIAEDTSNPKMTFTMPNTFYDYWVRLRIESGRQVNETFYPMVREATILDDTYEPYIPDNTELMTWKANGVLGAKNLLPINQSINETDGNNIKFTLNADNSIQVETVGTNTAGRYKRIFQATSADKYPLIAGKRYKVSGCPSNGDSERYYLLAEMNSQSLFLEIGAGKEFVAPAFNTKFDVYIRIAPNYQIDTPVTFKPMITLAEDTASDYAYYQPYAMTNRELTNAVYGQWESVKPTDTDKYDIPTSYIYYRKIDNILFLLFRIDLKAGITLLANAENLVMTLPEGYRPSSQIRTVLKPVAGYEIVDVNFQVVIETNGKVMIYFSGSDYTTPKAMGMRGNFICGVNA